MLVAEYKRVTYYTFFLRKIIFTRAYLAKRGLMILGVV